MRRDSGRGGEDDEMSNMRGRREIRMGYMWRGGR